jgi:hypothetical protein
MGDTPAQEEGAVSTQPQGEMSVALPRRVRAGAHARVARRARSSLGVALLLATWWLRRATAWLRRSLPQIATGLAAAIPVLRSTVHAVAIGWQPAGDDGIIVTRAWDVFTFHAPLVGQYSEAGRVTGHIVHSPGPLLYWLLALPARFGSVADLAGWMGAVNTLAIIGAVLLARRRGGLALMFAAAVAIALMCQSLPSESFHDVWNPAAALFPFLLLIFLCWSLACGDYRLAPLAVLLASFVTQTHLTYLAPTLAMIAAIAGCVLVARVRARRVDSRGEHAVPRPPSTRPALAPEVRAVEIPAAEIPAAGAAAMTPAESPRQGIAAALAADWPTTDDLMSPPPRDVIAPAPPAEAEPVELDPDGELQAPARPALERVRAGARSRRSIRRWVLAAVAVGVVCWAAPTIDEIEHSPGNLTLVAQTTRDRGATIGIGAGWNAVVRSLGVTPWWLSVPRSEWERKAQVRVTPGAGTELSAIVIIVGLIATAVVAFRRRRRALGAAAVIALFLCAALGADVSQTPAIPLLAATVGYSAWWGSILGMWVWLVLAWALALVLAPRVRSSESLLALRARWGADVPAVRPRLALALLSLACLAVVAEAGVAVAATERRDSHAHLYRPIAAIVARLDQVVSANAVVRYALGHQSVSTQPMEPAIRFGLVRHGDLPLSFGSLERLGSHYELSGQRYRWVVLVADGARRRRGMARVVTVSFRDGFGPSVYSAWVARVGPRGQLERPAGVGPARSYAFGRRIG